MDPTKETFYIFRTRRIDLEGITNRVIPHSITYTANMPQHPSDITQNIEYHFPVNDNFQWDYFAGNLVSYISNYILVKDINNA